MPTPCDYVLHIPSRYKSWKAGLCVSGLISIFPSTSFISSYLILYKPFKVLKSKIGQLRPSELKVLLRPQSEWQDQSCDPKPARSLPEPRDSLSILTPGFVLGAHSNFVKQALSPFSRWGNWGLGGWNNLPMSDSRKGQNHDLIILADPKMCFSLTTLRPLQLCCFGASERQASPSRSLCDNNVAPQCKKRYQGWPPHPHLSAPAAGSGIRRAGHIDPCCSRDLYGAPPHPTPQPIPEPIVSPGDNTDKGPSLVGCLHQSVTMETHRETIPKPSLSPSTLQLWLQEPSLQQEGHGW